MPHTVIVMFKLYANLSYTINKGFPCHSHKTNLCKDTLEDAFQDHFWQNFGQV